MKKVVNELLVNETEVKNFDYEELSKDEVMSIDGGDCGWLGSCVVAGSACSLNGGGLAWGVCVCLGVSYRKN